MMADKDEDQFSEPLAGSKEARERYGAELKRFGLEHDSEKLEVVSPYEPAGDQPQAIAKPRQTAWRRGLRYQTLLGVTGSGKTFTMAKTIEAVQQANAHHGAEQDARGTGGEAR
jgi:excinuclease ABC subunit B